MVVYLGLKPLGTLSSQLKVDVIHPGYDYITREPSLVTIVLQRDGFT